MDSSPAMLILAGDHRARGVLTVENYSKYLGALKRALPYCDGILASAQPMGDLVESGSVKTDQKTYLSINRTGLAGSVFEIDDRLVASVGAAKELGYTGIKHMMRVDLEDPLTSGAVELMAKVVEEARACCLDALVEPVMWRDGKMLRDTDSIILAAVIAHDIGAPLLKVPVPDLPLGQERVDAVARVVDSVGVPVLFLGGPSDSTGRRRVLLEAGDVMRGGAAGLAVGRTIYQDPDPAGIAEELSKLVHRS